MLRIHNTDFCSLNILILSKHKKLAFQSSHLCAPENVKKTVLQSSPRKAHLSKVDLDAGVVFSCQNPVAGAALPEQNMSEYLLR
jgi:hypothetical protein